MQLRLRLFRAAAIAMVSVAVAMIGAPRAGAQDFNEYEVKAEFLARFAHFVTWEASAFDNANSPIVIGVLGDDPMGRDLDRACAGQRTDDGRSLKVKRSRNAANLADCHIVFVCDSERARVDGALAALGRNTLTVGDWGDFTRQGGAIAFFTDGKKIRFSINKGAATRAELRVNSMLLALSKANN